MRAALGAALESGPSHAYLFRGPRGAGKRAAARAFAAEILAAGAEDPDDARRRALLDPSPHPDLVWLAPSGAQHLVEAVRERVIRAASYRPFEGGRRVFVLESAEAMRDESQNALLKTLEEPPGFAHLILLSSEPEALLETIASRCQPVEFAALPSEAVEAALEADPGIDAGDEEIAAAARLSAGDLELARFLLTDRGQEAPRAARALGRSGPPADRLDALARAAEGRRGGRRATPRPPPARRSRRRRRRGSSAPPRRPNDEAKRAGRRRRTETLDLGLALCASWFRDLAAIGAGAEEVVFNRDRLAQLRAAAEGLDPAAARRAAELVQDTRRRLDLNVSEELALEALCFRLEREIEEGGGEMGEGAAIRRATVEDAGHVARLLHEFNSEYDEPTPGVEALTEHARGLLEAGEITALLAGEAPDGFCLLRFHRSIYNGRPDAYVQELYVVPARRGEGLGRALLDAALDAAREAGAPHIELTTSEDDTEALALYESSGFTNREGGPDGPRMLYFEREL